MSKYAELKARLRDPWKHSEELCSEALAAIDALERGVQPQHQKEKPVKSNVIDLTPQPAWRPIETAPKGEPKPYGRGPQIYACAIGDGWHVVNIVHWNYHKDPTRGAWRGPNGVWTPDYWWDFGGGATTPELPAALAAMEEKP